MYEPLDKEIIEQAIVEDRVSNTFEQKKTSVEHICEQMVICEQRIESAKKEYEAKKGIVHEEEAPEKEVMSGIPARPYCKGRNYDPNRYSKTEE